MNGFCTYDIKSPRIPGGPRRAISTRVPSGGIEPPSFAYKTKVLTSERRGHVGVGTFFVGQFPLPVFCSYTTKHNMLSFLLSTYNFLPVPISQGRVLCFICSTCALMCYSVMNLATGLPEYPRMCDQYVGTHPVEQSLTISVMPCMV